jgi:acyl-CoA hydrolase
MEARPARATYVEATHLVLPGQANALGSLFGGEVCAWIDLACSVAGMRHCHRPVVTASMDDLHFHAPIRVGQVAVVQAQVNAVFRTSMEIGAFVWSEDPYTGDRRHTSTAYLTFVALDANGKPTELPPLLLETDDERKRSQEALERRQARLARRKAVEKAPTPWQRP